MAGNALIDTGAIIAILNGKDPWHGACLSALRSLKMPLITSEAVLAETFYMVGARRKDMEAAWSFVRSGVVKIAPIEMVELPEVHALMSKYWDRPMDFADATLVHLAARHSLTTILTIDHSDFETYRIGGRTRFRVVPSRLH